MNLIPPMILIVKACAQWMENTTTNTSFTNPRSRHQPQERHTQDYVTQLSSLDIKTMYAYLVTIGIST